MVAALPIVADPAVLAEDQARLGRQLARLERLADLGLEVAEALAAQAKGSGPAVAEGDIALAYDRVARAVRMAMLLQARLVEEARRPPPGPGPRSALGAPAADPAGARKDQIARIVRRVAEDDEQLDEFQAAWAGREARERLEHDDVYGQVMARPVSDLVADICRDLGLTPDWASLAEEAWARDEIDRGEAGAALLGADGGIGEEAHADHPPPLIPTFEDRLQALARDPDLLAVARRESG